MPSEITWLGHSCFSIRSGDHDILVDPFLNDSPVASKEAEEVAADFILLTHAHFDHIADAGNHSNADKCHSGGQL